MKFNRENFDPEGPGPEDSDLMDDESAGYTCPSCGADMYDEYSMCPACGAWVTKEPDGQQSEDGNKTV